MVQLLLHNVPITIPFDFQNSTQESGNSRDLFAPVTYLRGVHTPISFLLFSSSYLSTKLHRLQQPLIIIQKAFHSHHHLRSRFARRTHFGVCRSYRNRRRRDQRIQDVVSWPSILPRVRPNTIHSLQEHNHRHQDGRLAAYDCIV